MAAMPIMADYRHGWDQKARRRQASGWLLVALLLCNEVVSVASSLSQQPDSMHGANATVFAEPTAAVISLFGSSPAAADARRLNVITHTLPAHSRLKLGSAADTGVGQSVTLYAGLEYTPLTVDVTPSFFQSLQSSPKIKLVLSQVDDSQAQSGACLGSDVLKLNKVESPYGEAPRWSGVGLDISVDTRGRSEDTVKFLMGGSYKICYSDNGLFNPGHADVLDISLSVLGVYDGCTTDGCLKNKPYYCYMQKRAPNAAGSCVLKYSDTGQGYTGSYGKGSWSQVFDKVQYDFKGVFKSASTKACTTPADATYIGSDGIDRYIDPTPASGRRQIALPQTHATLDGDIFQAVTVAACYCPNYGGCDEDSDFLQQLGLVHFFITKICLDVACAKDYLGVLPKYEFVLKVFCPTDACKNNNRARIKIVTHIEANDKPFWDSTNGCRTGIHSSDILPAGNCKSPTDCAFEGGERQDYKIFNGLKETDKLSFIADENGIAYGSERYDLRHRHVAKIYDYCFCTTFCEQAENWFKAGQFRVSPLRLVGFSKGTSASAQSVKAVEYVNVGGTLGLSRAVSEADSMGLKVGGLIKVLGDAALTHGDATCAAAQFSKTLVSGPETDVLAKNYAGFVGAPNDNDKLVFNNGEIVNKITVKRAGVVAICYCGIMDAAGTCTETRHWKLVARTSIKGPSAGQVWEFSVNVVSRLEYTGWGLESTNTIRIAAAGTSCSANSNNPRNQDPSVHVGCPENCQAVLNTPGKETDISTKITAYDSVACNVKNENCNFVFITGVDTAKLAHATIIEDSKTVLTFSADPNLENGDTLTLGDKITGGTSEELAALKGIYPYADAGTYMVGHKVTQYKTGNQPQWKVPIGWKAGSLPTFSVENGLGQWKRHSKGATREEIRGTLERKNLKVCWSYAGSGNYIAEAGTLSILNPPEMKSARVNLVSAIQDHTLPIIISFETSDRPQYTTALNSMRLKLLLSNLDLFEARFADGSAVPAATSIPEEAARINLCGQLFIEIWSSHSKGFPYPESCYFGPEYTMNTITVREFFIRFGKRNGLAPKEKYEIVMKAKAKSGVSTSDEVVHIFAMDDTVTAPYKAVELGKATLSRVVTAVASGSFPQFHNLGFKVQGTADGLLKLEADQALTVELRGKTSSPIVGGSLLRMIFWPLTVWNTGTACVAHCAPSSGNTCGSIRNCLGEAIVPGGTNQVVRMTLPIGMTPVEKTVIPKIILSGLKYPDQGFFPTRIAAQLTDLKDANPHYVDSQGAFIFKPSSGSGNTVASVVTTRDCNARPFRGDNGNDLYFKIVFSVTLFSNADNDGSFLVMLPPGYTCVSASAAESSLSIFGAAPQGRGVISTHTKDGTWEFNQNECRYNLKKNGVIYAGTTIYVKIQANNPAVAMPRSAVINKWYLLLFSKGQMSSGTREMPQITFEGDGISDGSANFGANQAVLGKLTDALVQPSNFAEGAQHVVKVFFKTEQGAGNGGMLLFDSPDHFNVVSPCDAGHLADPYYATGAILTLRLPGIKDCVVGRFPASSNSYNRANIRVEGSIEASMRYGFQILMKNPQKDSFNADMMTKGWRLSIQTASKYGVDGTPEPMRLSPNDNEKRSWGMYQKDIDMSTRFIMQLSTYKPYSLTKEDAEITIFPIQTSGDYEAKLRIIAPLGYQWMIDTNYVKYKGKVDSKECTDCVPGANKDLPGAMPTVQNENVLVWGKSKYFAKYKYGYIGKIRVPDATPTSSTNSFIVEFGYDETEIDKRFEAGSVDLPNVKALQNGKVLFSHNVEKLPVDLTFEIQTISEAPRLGGLLIMAPKGFEFDMSCDAQPVKGAALKHMLPPDTRCASALNRLGEPEISLTAYGATINPGSYKFVLRAKNPPIMPNPPNSASKCGTEHCWGFMLLRTMMDRNSHVDRSVWAAGFAVNARMPEAELVPLTMSERMTARRNDRPGESSFLIFAFRLHRDATTGLYSDMKVKGPKDFQFDVDCLSGVATDASALGVTLDESKYTPWEASSGITRCYGMGNSVTLKVKSGLRAGRLYPFRMAVKKNPLIQPSDGANYWTIEYNGESCQPFKGFQLWTFSDTSLTPISNAQSEPGPLGSPTTHPVILTFRPHNAVAALLRIRAPLSFAFMRTGDRCRAVLSRKDDPKYWSNLTISEFKEDDFICQVDLRTPFVMNIILRDKVALEAGGLYHLITHVENPVEVQQALDWRLQSFANREGNEASFLDEARIPGFEITYVATKWTINHFNEQDEPQDKGNTKVKGLLLTLGTPSAIMGGDIFIVSGPTGFEFTDPSEPDGPTCNEFKWDTTASEFNLIDRAKAECLPGGIIKIEYYESKSLDNKKDEFIAFRISTVNPRQTPHWTSNFWRFKLHNKDGALKVAGLAHGYTIVPQLEELDVDLSSSAMMMGASSVSEIQITFRAVSNCDEVQIQATYPDGFDLVMGMVKEAMVLSNNRTALAKVPATVLGVVTDLPRSAVRLRMSIQAEQLVQIVLQNVRLGNIGGVTYWSVSTFVSGVKTDSRSALGFRLPGSITVLRKNLVNVYAADPVEYPIKSQWLPQVNQSAVAEFVVTFSNPVKEMENIHVSTDADYMLRVEGMTISRGRERISTVALPPTDETAQLVGVKLFEPLQLGTEYIIRLPVRAATTAAGKERWRFQTFDGEVLPTHTNDAQTLGFGLVEVLDFSIVVEHAPPSGRIPVKITVDPKRARPTDLYIVPPSSYTFPKDCLADKQTDSSSLEVVAFCAPMNRYGQTVARLKINGDLKAPLTVDILTESPYVDPERRLWYVEALAGSMQVGWGERDGFLLTPLPNIEVHYAGIAQITTAIAFSFDAQRAMKGTMSQLRLKPPKFYRLSCDADFLATISLPPLLSCSPDPLTLQVNGTLDPGRYAFTIGVSVPMEAPPPTENLFHFMILDGEGETVDANMEVSPRRIEKGLKADEPLMAWTNSNAGAECYITFGIRFKRNLPPTKEKQASRPRIAALLLEMPVGFEHLVKSIRDVRTLNNRFPLLPCKDSYCPWAEYDHNANEGSFFNNDTEGTRDYSRLRIVRDETQTVPADSFSWAFPVRVPVEMPRENFWILSLCKDPACTEAHTDLTVVSFVLGGFDHGEVSKTIPFNPYPPASGAHQQFLWLSLRACIFALVLRWY